MIPIDLALSFVAAWLLTYAIHSTLLLGGVWLLVRSARIPLPLVDTLWKAALLGGLVTSVWQTTGIGWEPFGGRVELPRPSVVLKEPDGPGASTGAALGGFALLTSDVAPEMRYREAIQGPGHKARPDSAFSMPANWPWMRILGVVWVLGACVATGRLATARHRLARRLGGRREICEGPLMEMLQRLRNRGRIGRRVRLTASQRVAGPMAIGSNEICIPERAVCELTHDEQESALAHELAHLARRDPTWRLVTGVLEGVFFFQPLNRMARRQLQESAEYLCDDWAVQQTGRGLTLARCLAVVAAWVVSERRPDLVSAMTEGGSPLVRRVERLLEGKRGRGAPRVLRASAAAVLLVSVASIAPGMVTKKELSEGHRTRDMARAIERIQSGAAPAAMAQPAAVTLLRQSPRAVVLRRGPRPVIVVVPQATTAELLQPRTPAPPAPPATPAPPQARECPRVRIHKRIAIEDRIRQRIEHIHKTEHIHKNRVTPVAPAPVIRVQEAIGREIRLLNRMPERYELDALRQVIDAWRRNSALSPEARAERDRKMDLLRREHEMLGRLHWGWI